MKGKHGMWVLCLAVFGALLLATAASADRYGSGFTMTDTYGDGGAAPDITFVNVADQGGMVKIIVYGVGFGLSDNDSAGVATDVVLDTTPAEGEDEYGGDYRLEIGEDGNGIWTGLWEWDEEHGW